MQEEPVLLVPEAAQLLRVSVSHIYRMCERGELPGACKVGGLWRIDRARLLDGLGMSA